MELFTKSIFVVTIKKSKNSEIIVSTKIKNTVINLKLKY